MTIDKFNDPLMALELGHLLLKCVIVGENRLSSIQSDGHLLFIVFQWSGYSRN